MRVPGKAVLAGLFVLVALFMAGVWVVSDSLRQEYRVASRGDTERTDLDLTDERVVWLEDVHPGGAVMAYDIPSRKRATLEPRNASLEHPVLLDGDLAAWVERGPDGFLRVVVHDFARGGTSRLGAAGDDLTLPGRVLDRDVLGRGALLVRGTLRGDSAVRVYHVPLADGGFYAEHGLPVERPLVLSRGRAWWADGPFVKPYDLGQDRELPPLAAGGNVTEFDVEGDVVVWAEDRGLVRRVHWARYGRDFGSAGEVSGFEGDQHGPAVNGSRVVFVQRDGLVRFKDLESGAERVLPARTQENIHLRLAQRWAGWLSGTIEGHNVLLVPV